MHGSCGQLMYTALGRIVCGGQTATLIKLFVERTCGTCSTYIHYQVPVYMYNSG